MTPQKSDDGWVYDEGGMVITLLERDDAKAAELLSQHVSDGEAVVQAMPTVAQIQAALDALVEQHLDATAQALGYKDMERAVGYATSKTPRFSTEGKALRDYRDDVWLTCYRLLAEVMQGKREVPTGPELMALMPVFTLEVLA